MTRQGACTKPSNAPDLGETTTLHSLGNAQPRSLNPSRQHARQAQGKQAAQRPSTHKAMCSAIGSWVNPVADAEFWKLRVDREGGGRSTRRVEFSAYDFSEAHGARSPVREHGKRKFVSGSEHLFTNSVGVVPIMPRPATQQLQRPFVGPRSGIETARDVMFPRESFASTSFSATSVSIPATPPLSPRNRAPFGTQLQPIALQSQRSRASLSGSQRGFGRPLRTPFASRLR